MRRELKFQRPKRSHSNRRNVAIISVGFIVVMFVAGYLYLNTPKQKEEPKSKTIFLSVENNSEMDTPAPIRIKINGNEVFSTLVGKEESKEIDVKLTEGVNKIEFFVHGMPFKQDRILFGKPKKFNLVVNYYDSAGQQQINYKTEESAK